ncbi:M50 family metallopeptidase [Glacieibacterium sp.]|uniref:M50 family metallopeptidase n=1 Tax=Glacieibacterium sp. TaxID=2860237 RepID=UPI003B001CD8
MNASPGIAFTVMIFAAVIGVLVFVHEFGHYGVARLLGIRADVFSIGFGRELVGWTDRRGTRWKLSLLPLGGYVKFTGDENAASQPPSDLDATPIGERAGLFHYAPLWQRALVTVAGPVTNFLLAIAIFAAFFMVYGRAVTPPRVAVIEAGSAASTAGLLPGDLITQVDGTRIERFEQLSTRIVINTGEPMLLRVVRDGVDRPVTVTPRVIHEVDNFGNRYQIGRLGLRSGPPEYRTLGLLSAVPAAVAQTAFLTRASVEGLWQIVSGRRSIDEMGGPIKMAQMSGQQATLGLPYLIGFMALISINLGFINLLPVPMLDGGHLFLYALEAVRRQPLGKRVQEWAFASGFAALVSLMVFLTWHDLGGWKRLSTLLG